MPPRESSIMNNIIAAIIVYKRPLGPRRIYEQLCEALDVSKCTPHVMTKTK